MSMMHQLLQQPMKPLWTWPPCCRYAGRNWNKHVGRNTIGLKEKCCTILSFTDSGKRAKFGPRCWWGQKLAGQDISQISPASIDPSHPHYIYTSFWYPWQWLSWYRHEIPSINPYHPHYISMSFWYPWQWLSWYCHEIPSIDLSHPHYIYICCLISMAEVVIILSWYP